MDYFRNLINKNTPESSMRWIFVWTFFFINIVIWSAWFGVSLVKSSLQDFPSGLVAMVNGIFLIITGGAIFNKKEETKQNADSTKNVLDANQKS